MGINAASICDIKSDQTIKGKKSFSQEVRAPAFALMGGPRIASNATGGMVVNGSLQADKFEGDGSGLINFSVKNMNANDIEQSIAINGADYLLVQKVFERNSELKKIKIGDLLTLIPDQNGVLFNFITDGANKGPGAQVLKGRTTSGRSQILNLRSLTGGPNIEIVEGDNDINISIKETVTLHNLEVNEALVVPRCSRGNVAEPVNGMLIYDESNQRFYGYAKNRWLPTRQSFSAGPNIQLLQSENEIDIKLKNEISVDSIRAEKIFIAPHRNIDEIKTPVNGTIVYDKVSESFYGYANNKWVPLQGP